MRISEPVETDSEEASIAYGQADATYKAAGEIEGIQTLVDYFYDAMETEPSARPLRLLHAEDLTESREKLTAFLSGWMGGHRLYQERYGSISIPSAHAHLEMDKTHGDQWLHCMKLALDKMDYPQPLKDYLFKQLSIPVSMVVKRAELDNS